MQNGGGLLSPSFCILHPSFCIWTGGRVFPLAGKEFPATADELVEAIHDALAQVLTLSNNGSATTAEAESFPAVKKLKINLNNAQISASEPPPKPKPTGKREPGIRVDQLEVSGKPVKYEQNK